MEGSLAADSLIQAPCRPSATVAALMLSLVLGIGIGSINLYYELQVIQHDLTGIPLAYQFPLGIAALLVPLILFAAFGSAILPAERAVRGSLVRAFEYE